MPKHTNAASRLHGLLSIAQGIDSRRPAHEGWAQIFNLDPKQNIYTAMAVMERMLWLQVEIESIKKGMAKAEFSESLYAPSLSQVLNAIGPFQMGSTWEETRKSFTSEVLTSIAFCAEILPDEECSISSDDLAAIVVLTSELSALLEVSALPDSLRALIAHHIDLIYRALARYPINGAIAFRDAAHTALGEIVTSAPELGRYGDVTEVKKLEGLWSKVNAIADTAIKTEKLYVIGQKIGDILAKLSG